jgi:hypothetical protein
MRIPAHLLGGGIMAAMGALVAPVLAQPETAGRQTACALFERVQPILEEIVGMRLDRPLMLGQATAEEWRHLADPLLIHQLRWQFPDLRHQALDRAVVGAAVAWRRSLLARAMPGSNSILLLPNALLWPHVLADGFPEGSGYVESDAILQLVLTQEAARAYLDQRYGLARRLAESHDGEEFQALQALFEGRVQWITRQVARRLGTERYFPLLARCLQLVPDDEPDVSLRDVGQSMLQRRHWACVAGLAFFDYLDQQGMRDAEALVFAQPPHQVEWIDHPELYYRAHQDQRPELAKALARLADTLPSAEWSPVHQPWTPDMVREAASLLGARERADKVLAAWDEGRSLVWTARGNAPSEVALGVVRFTSAAGARGYQGLAIDLQRKQDELLSEAGARVPLQSTSRTVQLTGVDEATRTDKILPSGKPMASVLLVRNGSVIIELSWYGREADMPWAEQLVRQLLGSIAATN